MSFQEQIKRWKKSRGITPTVEEVPMTGMQFNMSRQVPYHDTTTSATNYHDVQRHTLSGSRDDRNVLPLIGFMGFVSLLLILIGFLIGKLVS